MKFYMRGKVLFYNQSHHLPNPMLVNFLNMTVCNNLRDICDTSCPCLTFPLAKTNDLQGIMCQTSGIQSQYTMNRRIMMKHLI